MKKQAQNQNRNYQPSPNRYASIGDALRGTFRTESALLPPWMRSVFLLGAVPLMSIVAESAWPLNAYDRDWAIIWGAPVAFFLLLGWLDEFFPI
ncbi:MAG TPA: hypothetical protein VF292_08550 [Rhodanobacteraceae bacterium]